MILAELSSPDVPWSVTSQFIFGALGLLGVISLVFTVAIQAKKLFGKSPPLDDQINTLRNEFKKSVAGAYRRIEEERHDREEAFADLALERQRTLANIRNDFESIRIAQAVTNQILQQIKENLK